LTATKQPVDTGAVAGKAILDMLGALTQFETNLRRESQLEGISAAKARGVYKGRKLSVDAVEILRLRREEQLGPAAIARWLAFTLEERWESGEVAVEFLCSCCQAAVARPAAARLENL
jgi:DNA invertase Pin-like site-specific DNA recombinase